MTSSDLSQDEIFAVLRSARRRYTLYYLRRHGPTADLSSLAMQVAAWEHDIPPEELTTKQRKRVYISLYQTHLPTLDGCGLLDFDDDTGTIHLADHARTLDTYLAANARSPVPWYHYYLSLSLMSLFLIGGVWSGGTLLSDLSQLTTVTLIVCLYTLVAVGHYVYYRHYFVPRPPVDR